MIKTVLITRPLAQAQSLAMRIGTAGFQPIIFPAFEIRLTDQLDAFDQALLNLDQYQLVIFVSPNAIHQTLERLKRTWPNAVAIGVVGPGSLKTLASYGITAPAYQVICPQSVQYDSEGLFEQLPIARLKNQPVLIVKGNGGRPWLAQQLSAAGICVDTVESYQRICPDLSQSQIDSMRSIIRSHQETIVLITSSEAIENLLTLMNEIDDVQGQAWLKAQSVIVPHARIEERAKHHGFIKVNRCGTGDDQIVQALALLDS